MYSKATVFDHLYNLASFMPGIGLTLGYLGAWIVTLSSPPKNITVTDELAIRHQQKLGDMPNWRFEFEPDMGTSPIMADIPERGADGKPVLKPVQKAVRGRGRPTIYIASQTEVTIPTLGNPPYDEERRLLRSPVGSYTVIRRDGRPGFIRKELLTGKEREERKGFGEVMFDYYPNIEQRKTGVRETVRSVGFEPYFDQNSVSIWWGIIGTVVGLSIFIMRLGSREKA
jgi:hypothetical protein